MAIGCDCSFCAYWSPQSEDCVLPDITIDDRGMCIFLTPVIPTEDDRLEARRSDVLGAGLDDQPRPPRGSRNKILQ